MPIDTPSAWQRLEEVMRSKGYPNARTFAVAIGLSRAATLYQIKGGKQEISKRLAGRITAVFPDIDHCYLLTGRRSDNSALLPFYITDPAGRFRSRMPPDNYIAIPYRGVTGLSLATVNNEAEPIRGVFPNTVIIVGEASPERFSPGRPHLIETEWGLLLRYIGDDERTGHYRLWSDNADKTDMVLPAREIKSIFALRYTLNIF